MNDSYLSIEEPAAGLYKEKGSKFIALAYPVSTESQIKDILASVKKEHHAARHWCYAWRLGVEKKHFRSNDDGEPSGTAGKPILGQIISADVTDVLVVVVRYFGGTLLGTGGLITAYKSAAADAFKNASIVARYVTKKMCVRFDTKDTNEILRRLKEFNAVIHEHAFYDNNEITFSIRASNAEKLRSLIEQNNIPCQLSEA
jgi:uncharacterized YigZ family protein